MKYKSLLKRLSLSSFRIIITAVLIISAVPLQKALAYDENFYSGNDILYYDDRAPACLSNSTTSSSGTGGSSADQNKNAEAILRNLTGKGLTLAQASGFVGNMKQESGLNPAIIQGGKTADAGYSPKNGVGFGLVQWTFTSRQKPLVDLAAATNRPITDINLQMDYVWQEVNGGWKSTIQALTASSTITPTQAAIIVHGKTSSDPRLAIAPSVGYEASGDSADKIVSVRGGNAEYFYKMFVGKIPDGTGVQGSGSTNLSAIPTSNDCPGGAAASADCPITAPVFGNGGNGHQLTREELIATFGGPSPDAIKPNLTDVDFLGKSVQVNKLAAGCLTAVANEIKASNNPYVIRSIGGYRYDSNNGSSNIGEKSYHTYGVAIDINPDTNPFTSGSGPHDMPQEYIDAFAHHGWSWGGNWRSVKDYMHFEFNGLGPKG